MSSFNDNCFQNLPVLEWGWNQDCHILYCEENQSFDVSIFPELHFLLINTNNQLSSVQHSILSKLQCKVFFVKKQIYNPNVEWELVIRGIHNDNSVSMGKLCLCRSGKLRFVCLISSVPIYIGPSIKKWW